MKKKNRLSVIIIARNEEAMIMDCLKSVKPVADEIILIDQESEDKTVAIAKKYGAKIINLSYRGLEFAKWRNVGLKAAKSDWVLYVDADERLTPELRREIVSVVSPRLVPPSEESIRPPRTIRGETITAYKIPRRNFYLGQAMHYGGAWPDYVNRLFKRQALKKWVNELHEDPVFEGQMGKVASPLIHLTHRDLSSMIAKTNQWSKIEARLLHENYPGGHPPMTWWRLLRPMLTEFWQRGIVKQGLRDGPAGWIEVIFQMFSRFITYARLWELQQKKS